MQWRGINKKQTRSLHRMHKIKDSLVVLECEKKGGGLWLIYKAMKENLVWNG